MVKLAPLIAAALVVGAESFALGPGARLPVGSANGRHALRPLSCSLRASAQKTADEAAAGESAHPGRRKVLQSAISMLLVTSFGREASAKKAKEKPCKLPMCVQATSPGVALDMIILMKATKAMREAGEKLDAGDFKAIEKWLSDSFSSTSFAFIKKTKVLESLATSLLGVSVADDFDEDPSFSSEDSVDSKKAAAMAQEFYGKVATIQAAVKAKDQEEATAAFEEAVESLDALLAAYKMPDVANASPDAVRTPK